MLRALRREVVLEGGPPLGVDPDAHFPTTPTHMDPEDAFVLFTDGLVERRDTDIDVCVHNMIDDLQRWRNRRGKDPELAELVDFLARREAPQRVDDVALLAVQRVIGTGR